MSDEKKVGLGVVALLIVGGAIFYQKFSPDGAPKPAAAQVSPEDAKKKEDDEKKAAAKKKEDDNKKGGGVDNLMEEKKRRDEAIAQFNGEVAKAKTGVDQAVALGVGTLDAKINEIKRLITAAPNSTDIAALNKIKDDYVALQAQGTVNLEKIKAEGTATLASIRADILLAGNEADKKVKAAFAAAAVNKRRQEVEATIKDEQESFKRYIEERKAEHTSYINQMMQREKVDLVLIDARVKEFNAWVRQEELLQDKHIADRRTNLLRWTGGN